MLVTFKSKAAAEVIMYEDHAKLLLEPIGKDVKRGVITAAEVAAAVARIEAAVNESKLHPDAETVKSAATAHRQDDEDDRERSQQVSFATRAYPLLEMLRAAQKSGNDVMWGV
ncbi:MAG: DUF1840 domain-containing protein [Burkholderiales bacterium]